MSDPGSPHAPSTSDAISHTPGHLSRLNLLWDNVLAIGRSLPTEASQKLFGSMLLLSGLLLLLPAARPTVLLILAQSPMPSPARLTPMLMLTLPCYVPPMEYV
jgi:hypothetical protein